MKASIYVLMACALACWLFFAKTPCQANQTLLFTSHEYLARNNQIQNFQDWMTLKPGQENLPLRLNIYNGSHEIPSYKWFRITIGGYLVATEANLRGAEEGSVDVSGVIQGGNMQILVEAGGVPGAALWFNLSAPKTELHSIDPEQVRQGQKIVLGGNNFSSQTNQNTVYLNSKTATVLSSTASSIVAQVPADADLGPNRVEVSVNGMASQSLSLNVYQRPAPELIAFDVWMAPPGGTVTLTGRNFSNRADENKVFFGSVPAAVSSATTTQLVIIVPTWSWGPSQLNIPVSVVVDGVRSANTLPMDIGPMYHGATPQFQQD
ncbi:MAG: IPT/TIG domain-containing protein [Candidatus Obscuribacterales bacterium]|nr:IPT/TIG domain-containing protein [Candidatus Obscuribacterales bacterium]